MISLMPTSASTATAHPAFSKWRREGDRDRDLFHVEELQYGRRRVGFCLGNRKLIGALARIKSYLDYGIFQPIQIASIIALRECGDRRKKICATYQNGGMCWLAG